MCRGAEDPLLYHMFALLLSGGRACVALCSSMGAARMRSPWPAVTLLYIGFEEEKKNNHKLISGLLKSVPIIEGNFF